MFNPLCVFTCDGVTEQPVNSYSQRLVPVTKASAYLAPKTVGDGNCFFHAALMLAFGHEGKHEEMHLRTIVELVINSEFYLPDKDNEQRMVAQERVFIQSSEKKSVKIDHDILKTEFEVDVLMTATVLTRSSDWHLQAL